MAYIIGIIIGLIALVITGLIIRKKIYDEVDRLESWKMDIMNRNVSSELTRVKSLNLSGETQEQFESWKDKWENILSRQLPDIEEYLFDAEEAADRYRVPAAKKNLRTVEDVLNKIEREIEQVYEELEQLLSSEENSRKEVSEMKPLLKGLRKNLLQNSYQFGKAAELFETEMDELEASFRSYDELTASGNYFEAQGIVSDLKERLDALAVKMKEFPSLYKHCKHELPSQINELLSGISNMKDDGYRIEQLDYEKELIHHQEKLAACIDTLENGHSDEALELSNELDERIKEMYDRLEQEALARNYVEKQLPVYETTFAEAVNEFNETKAEIERLQETYYFEDHDLEAYTSLEQWITSSQNQFNKVKEDLEKKTTTHLDIKLLVENGVEDLQELQAREKEFKEQVRQLRKEELDAQEQVQEMKAELNQTKRKIQKSNVPGIPDYIWSLVDETAKKIDNISIQLQKSPLDMGAVQRATDEAEKQNNQLNEQVEFMLEQARLVELVIQYANRYRSQHEVLAAKLAEAELLFRHFEYEEALEQAAAALQRVEPGALKRLEEFSQVPS